jgi:hypothetical protein
MKKAGLSLVMLFLFGCEMLGVNMGGSTPSNSGGGEKVTSTKTTDLRDGGGTGDTKTGTEPEKSAAKALPKVKYQFSFGKTEADAMAAKPGEVVTFGPNDEIYAYAKLDKAFFAATGLKEREYVNLWVYAVEQDKKIHELFVKEYFLKYWGDNMEFPFEILPSVDHYFRKWNETKKLGKEPKNWGIQQDAINESLNRVFPVKLMSALAELPNGKHTLQIVLKTGGFAEEPYLAGGTIVLEVTDATRARCKELVDKLEETRKTFATAQPDIDYSKIKGTNVKWGGPYAEKTGGGPYAAVPDYGDELYWDGRRVAKFDGDALWRGIIKMGSMGASGYTAAGGGTVTIRPATGGSADYNIELGGKVVGKLIRDAKKDTKIDPRGRYNYKIMKGGSQWGTMYSIEEENASDRITRLLAVLYHFSDFFR